MEPMTLGSPVHNSLSMSQTPTSGNLGVDATSNMYYPSYLMGENQVSMGLRIAPGSMSPTRSMRTFSAAVSTPSPTGQSFRDGVLSGSRATNERQTGPPTLGLQLNSPFNSPITKTNINPLRDLSTVGAVSPCTPTRQSIPYSLYTPTPHTRVQSSDNEKENVCEIGRWVTVFGFPLSSTSAILAHFAQLGVITDHRLPIKGNWMHIKFQNPLQARKALAKHGKILNGSIMIAVSPCTEQALVSDINESISSPIANEDVQIRSLTNSFHSPRTDKGVVPQVRTPQKSDGFVSKALHHILGV